MSAGLIEAIDKRNQKEVKKILNAKTSNKSKDWFNDGSLVGPPLVLALNNLDSRMVEFLVDELGADVNRGISIYGKKSTLLIYAIKSLNGY